MEGVFESLERRFDGDAQLVATGRKLYLGLEGQRQKTLPCVAVSIGGKGDEHATFDADVETLMLDFEVLGASGHASTVAGTLQHMQRVFKAAAVVSEQFTTVSMRQIDMTGPVLEEGIYVGRAMYEMIVQRTTKLPVVQEV